MGSIDNNGIGSGIDQSLHTVERIGSHTNTCCHTQTTFVVLAGHGLILSLGDILIRDESDKAVILVDHGQFLNLVLLQNVGSSHQVGLLMSRNKVLLRHNLINRTIQATLKAQITVSDDADETSFVINDGNTADMIF